MATISYINSVYPGKKVYILATEEVKKSFIDAGVNIVDDDADIVLLAYDTTLTFEKLKKAPCNFRIDSVRSFYFTRASFYKTKFSMISHGNNGFFCFVLMHFAAAKLPAALWRFDPDRRYSFHGK